MAQLIVDFDNEENIKIRAFQLMKKEKGESLNKNRAVISMIKEFPVSKKLQKKIEEIKGETNE